MERKTPIAHASDHTRGSSAVASMGSTQAISGTPNAYKTSRKPKRKRNTVTDLATGHDMKMSPATVTPAQPVRDRELAAAVKQLQQEAVGSDSAIVCLYSQLADLELKRLSSGLAFDLNFVTRHDRPSDSSTEPVQAHLEQGAGTSIDLLSKRSILLDAIRQERVVREEAKRSLGVMAQRIEAQNNKIAQQDAKIAQQDAKTAQQDAKIAQQDTKTAQQDAKIAQQDAKTAQIERQLERLLSS